MNADGRTATAFICAPSAANFLNLGSKPSPGERRSSVADGVGVSGLTIELIQSAAEFEFDQAQERFQIDRLNEQRGQRVGRQIVDVVLDLVQRHARQEDHGQTAAVFLQMAQNMKAINAGHFQVQQNDVDFAVLKMFQRRAAIADLIDAVS